MYRSDMEKTNWKELNTTALAFMGDAVYEMYVRKHVMEQGLIRADMLHRATVHYVRAESQAAAVKSLMKDFLTEEETNLVKRARNHKSVSRARSAGPVAYKLATAFEALLGALYLQGEEERLWEICGRAVERIEESMLRNSKEKRTGEEHHE